LCFVVAKQLTPSQRPLNHRNTEKKQKSRM